MMGTSPRIFGGAITPWSRETAASVLFIESKNSAQRPNLVDFSIPLTLHSLARILIDTCVWLDLAKDCHHQQAISRRPRGDCCAEARFRGSYRGQSPMFRPQQGRGLSTRAPAASPAHSS